MSISPQSLVENPIELVPSATVACFDPVRGELPRRELDADRTVRYLSRLVEFKVPGLLIGASTGQGHLRTVEELDAWFRAAAQTELQDTVLEALLRPEDGLKANERLLDLLAELKYVVVFFRPGTDLPGDASDEQIYENLRPLVAAAAARKLAIGLYSISDVSGIPLSPEVTFRLVESDGGDRIVAAKVTEVDYEASTKRFLQHSGLTHLKIVQGWDTHLAKALQDGPKSDSDGRQRCGITSGAMALAVHQFLHLLQSAASEDWEELRESQQAVTDLFSSMQDDPGKFADLQRAKYMMGLGHPLTGRVESKQVERVFDALEKLPRRADRQRLARSLDLMGDGPFHTRLQDLYS